VEAAGADVAAAVGEGAGEAVEHPANMAIANSNASNAAYVLRRLIPSSSYIGLYKKSNVLLCTFL
jgi:hypothetical protein